MTYSNELIFGLEMDELMVTARRVADPTPGFPSDWDVALQDTEKKEVILQANILRNDTGGGEARLENAQIDPYRLARYERAVHAAAFLAATIAASPAEDAIVVCGENKIGTGDPVTMRILRRAGFVRSVVDHIGGQRLQSRAGIIRRSLGPTFAVGFSLSPAETD